MPERLMDSRIAALHQLIAALHERVAVEPVQAAEVLPKILEDLHTALEELHVAEEEQYQQNEALAAARLTAEVERQRYQELFDFAPDGYLVTDSDGMIQEANRAAAALLGVPQPHLLDKSLTGFIVERTPTFSAFLPRLRQLECMQDWEIHLQPWAGATFPAELTVATIHAAAGRGRSALAAARHLAAQAGRGGPQAGPQNSGASGRRAYSRAATYECPVAGRNWRAPTRRH